MNLDPDDVDENEYKKEYEHYWKEKVTDNQGFLDLDKVARELFDYNTLYYSVSSVYAIIFGEDDSVTPFTDIRLLLTLFEATLEKLYLTYLDELCEDLALHVLKDVKTEKDIGHNECLKDIINYLQEKKNVK